MISPIFRKLKTTFAAIPSILFAFRSNGSEESPVLEAKVLQQANQEIELGKIYRLINWNTQFAGSREHHFFYDGGPDVEVNSVILNKTLRSISKQLSEADISVLQEVDRDSDRTGRIDQLEEYRFSQPNLSTAFTPYHYCAYLPTPSHRPLARVDMHLVTLSKFVISTADRLDLSRIDEPQWRQNLNLKRAILVSSLPIANSDTELIVANTHLSAFSNGDGTLTRQVQQLHQWLSSLPSSQPWILAGDFNALPPGDDPSRLKFNAHLFADPQPPIEQLIVDFKHVFVDLLAPENRTYLPPESTQADRKLDYIFYGGPIEIVSSSVHSELHHLSDHLPQVIEFKIIIDEKNTAPI